jgi:hemoglobin
LPVITAVVDELVANVAADTRINKFFAGVDIPRLKGLLVEQICQATGGPCRYTGRSMKEAHMGMGLTNADFDALVEDLVKALDKFNVPAQEKNELLGLLGPMRPDIVEVSTVGMPRTGAHADWALLSAIGGILFAFAGLAFRKRAAGIRL